MSKKQDDGKRPAPPSQGPADMLDEMKDWLFSAMGSPAALLEPGEDGGYASSPAALKMFESSLGSAAAEPSCIAPEAEENERRRAEGKR